MFKLSSTTEFWFELLSFDCREFFDIIEIDSTRHYLSIRKSTAVTLHKSWCDLSTKDLCLDSFMDKLLFFKKRSFLIWNFHSIGAFCCEIIDWGGSLHFFQISVLLPLMENKKLMIPGRGDCIGVAPGFQFFATRRLR